MMQKYSNSLKRIQDLEEQLADSRKDDAEEEADQRDRERELMMHFMMANISL